MTKTVDQHFYASLSGGSGVQSFPNHSAENTVSDESQFLGEEWRPIKDFPNYEISNFGRARRAMSAENPEWVQRGRILKYAKRRGYLNIYIRNKTKIGFLPVARTVAVAFIGDPPTAQHQAAHNDGNPLNNHVSNIRWATVAENAADRKIHGTQRSYRASSSAILTPEDIKKIRSEYVPYKNGHMRLGKKYRISPAQIKNIVDRKCWKEI